MRNSWPFLVCLALWGCGGSSSGTPDDTRFSGDYMSSWVVAQTGEPSARADLRRVHADGWGTYATDFEPDSRFDEQVPYTLSADGALNGLTGIVSPEGALYAEGDLDPGDESLGFGIGIRLDRDASPFTLNGNYLACSMSFEVAGGAASTGVSSISADGLTTLASEILVSSDGANGSTSRLFNVLEGYLVVEGGAVGGVTADGSLFAIADQNGDSGATSLQVAIRTSSDATVAVCSGSYVGFGLVVDQSEVVTQRAVIDANGEGEVRITHAGSDGRDGFRVGSCTVSENGALDLDDGRTGVIREDGGVFALVDTDATDGAISIWICVRRS